MGVIEVLRARKRRSIVTVIVVLLMALALTPPTGAMNLTAPPDDSTASSQEASVPARPPAPSAEFPLPLGTLTTNGDSDPSCPSGFTCSGFEITCPGVQRSKEGFIAVAPAQGHARGVVLFFRGGHGTEWWTQSNPATPSFVSDLRAEGLVVVVARYTSSWLRAAQGDDAGTAHLGCFPATVVNHVHKQHFVPLGVTTALAECGFCITGNSGGASQVSYAVSHFGLDSILDAVIPTGGPPHSALAKSCLRRSGEEAFWYPDGTREFIDEGFGYYGGGPCLSNDKDFVSRWNAEAVSTGGDDYHHPTTRVHFILGDKDSRMQTQASDYIARLEAAGTPLLTVELAANTQHSIMDSDNGRRALMAAILSSGSGSDKQLSSSLRSSVSKTKYRKRFTLSGNLKVGPDCGGPFSVEVRKRTMGSKGFEVIARKVAVDNDGSWKLTHRSKRSASFRVTPSGGNSCVETTSLPADVLVKAKVSVSLPEKCSAPKGIRGRVRPNHRGTNVVLKRRGNSGWKTVDRDKLGKSSSFRLVVRNCRAQYRVVWPKQAPDNLRGRKNFSF